MSLKDEWRRLRAVDWGDLDVKEAGGWPFLLQLICCVLAWGLTLAGMYWYLAAPKAEELNRARAEETRLIREYQGKVAQSVHLEVMREEMAVLRVRMDALREMLPTSVEVPSLIDSINEAAIGNQLTIAFIRLRSPTSRAHYIEQPFDIRVRGDYHRIAEFLTQVAGLPRLVTQHDLTLEPVDDDSKQGLQLSMLARTYSYREPDADAP